MSETGSPPTPTRLRITFGKTGAMRYVGNLDMHTVWERTFRRARLPLAYTQGFNPRPRFQIAASLPLGAASRCELIDAWLTSPPELDVALSWLRQTAPPGLLIESAQVVNLHEPALQNRLESAEFIVTLRELACTEGLETRLADLLAESTLPRVWRGKAYDLRPLIESAALLSSPESASSRLALRLAAREGATGRPEEVLAALGCDPLSGSLERTALNFKELSPIPV